MSEPHPLCCQTCSFQTDKQYLTFCDKLRRSLYSKEYTFLKEVGCASHSQHPATDVQSIRQDEREKVLAKVEQYIRDIGMHSKAEAVILQVLCVVRKGGKQEATE